MSRKRGDGEIRRMLALMTALVLVAGGCDRFDATEVVFLDSAALLDDYRQSWDCWTGDELELQWQLTRWYAVSLESGTQDGNYQAAYYDILAGWDGMMGEMVFLDGCLVIPIYHDGNGGNGFVHSMDSPFPTGEFGVSDLRLSGNDARILADALRSMDHVQFAIRILDGERIYQVISEHENVGSLEHGGCRILLSWEDGEMVILAVLVT